MMEQAKHIQSKKAREFGLEDTEEYGGNFVEVRACPCLS